MIGTFFIINNLGFNPHTRIGCDAGVGEAIHDYLKFQSTHPYRVRHRTKYSLLRNTLGFNPRTRIGCDYGEHTLKVIATRFNPRTRIGCDFLY